MHLYLMKMKTLTRAGWLVVLVSCWQGVHLFASHTVCFRTLRSSAPLVGRLGMCMEWSHHLCICHLKGEKGANTLVIMTWEAYKCAATDNSVAPTSIVFVFHIDVGIREHPQDTRQTYTWREKSVNKGNPKMMHKWLWTKITRKLRITLELRWCFFVDSALEPSVSGCAEGIHVLLGFLHAAIVTHYSV